jgi:type I restriction enzyme S subunit
MDTARFFFYIMAWATTHGVFTAGGNESTIEHLPAERFRKYRFGFPPMSEQLAIAEFLDSELGGLDALTAEAERAIELLQERRTALISAAVTGRIDVRGLA